MTVREIEIQLALGSMSNDMKCELAHDYDTPKRILAILSTDGDWSVRYNVACNLNTSAEVLKKLSTDTDGVINYEATLNLNKIVAI